VKLTGHIVFWTKQKDGGNEKWGQGNEKWGQSSLLQHDVPGSLENVKSED